MKNIEVEIRGGLNKESYTIFLNFLKEKGEYIESQNRQMILLYDYPGFDINPLARNVDIRLRETNGFCELMIKNKITENNEARNEISINLSQNTWEENIFFLKSLGIKRGLWMKRKKEVYMFENVEYSLVQALNKDETKIFYYFEAEKVVDEEFKIEESKKYLKEKVSYFSYNIWTSEDYKAFVELLGREVNEEVLF